MPATEPLPLSPNASNLGAPPPAGRSVAAPGGPLPTSLDDSETTEQPLPRQSPAQRWTHRPWWKSRLRLLDALHAHGGAHLANRVNRLARCASAPIAVATPSGEVAIRTIRCRDRLCPLCSRRRAQEAAEQVGHYVAAMDAPRFLTLTAPAVDAPLGEQVRQLKAALKSMRRRKGWKSRVTRGVQAWQVTFNASTGRWHPHVHLVIDGLYYPQAEAREAWRDALNASTTLWRLGPDDPLVVDIRLASGRRQVGAYIARYVAKPDGLDTWPPERIAEYAEAMHGVRALQPFGARVTKPLDPADPNDDPATTTRLCPLLAVASLARRGHPAARESIRLLRALRVPQSGWLADGEPDPPPIADDDAPAAHDRLRRLLAECDRADWTKPDHRPPPPPPPPPPRTLPLDFDAGAV